MKNKLIYISLFTLLFPILGYSQISKVATKIAKTGFKTYSAHTVANSAFGETTCGRCRGSGVIVVVVVDSNTGQHVERVVSCPTCNGRGSY